MNSKPLAYESLKTVLQYMEPNIRFQISNQCPSIRKAEKQVPLRIDRLTFAFAPWKPVEVKVNDTVYSIGSYRDYPPDAEIPYAHRVENERGGAPFDVDRFGWPDYSSDSQMSAGDVVIGMERREILIPLDIENIKVEIGILKQSLGDEKQTGSIERNNLSDVNKTNNKELKYRISSLAERIQPFYNRRDNLAVTYTTMTHLTVESKSKTVYRTHKKLHEVEKHLNTVLLGNRKSVSVNCLNIYNHTNPILHLPANLKIQIRKFETFTDTFKMCDALQQIAHPSCLPLNEIVLSRVFQRDFQHPIVKSAKTLHILQKTRNTLASLSNVTNQNVKIYSNNFTLQDVIALIRNRLETRHPIETRYNFLDTNRQFVIDLLKILVKDMNGTLFGERCVIVPMNRMSQLKIFEELDGWNLSLIVEAVRI